MNRYGLAYKGSKNDIADWVVEHLPPSRILIDLFAGGCAVTHAALVSGKFSHVLANDVNDAPRLFLDAVQGKYRNETRWISREDFFALKDTDPYVRYIWSFGNNGADYLYGVHLEAYKKAYHYAAVAEDYSLFEAMGIQIPDSVKEKAHRQYGSPMHRKRVLGGYINNHMEEIIEKVKINFLEYIDKQKERWQDLLGKQIDTKKIHEEEERLRAYLCDALKESGLTQSEVNRRLGTFMAGHYFGRSQWAFPTYEEYTKMQEFLPLKENYFTVTKFLEVLKYLESLESLQSLERLESLQNLQSLQNLESLQSLERLGKHTDRLTIMQVDYVNVPLPPDCTIYCDPPYAGTDCGSYSGFEHERFYQWLRTINRPVIISEYAMPADFVCIAECRKIVKSGSIGAIAGVERLFCHESQINKLPKTTLF